MRVNLPKLLQEEIALISMKASIEGCCKDSAYNPRSLNKARNLEETAWRGIHSNRLFAINFGDFLRQKHVNHPWEGITLSNSKLLYM